MKENHMKMSRIVMLAAVFAVAAAPLCFGRSILEKKMYYLDNTGKIGEAKYWTVFLGLHEVTLTRKYPGEEPQPVTGNMNLSLLSSGYIEGNGYSARGKIDCLPTMKMRSEQGVKNISLDSIACIYEYGNKVLLVTGEAGDFIIDAEGQPVTAKRFQLSEFVLKNVDGEKELKPLSADKPIRAIAFTKEAILKAQKGITAPQPAPPTESK
jgi:hypothetical protein